MMIKEEYQDDSKESSTISIGGRRKGSMIELDNPSSDYFEMSNDSKSASRHKHNKSMLS